MTNNLSGFDFPGGSDPTGLGGRSQDPDADSGSDSDMITFGDVMRSLALKNSKPKSSSSATPSTETRQQAVQNGTATGYHASTGAQGLTVEAPGLLLCPLKQIQGYPYRYVGAEHKEEVKTWFQRNLWTDRYWDVYYAHDPESRRLPIFLVPTRQFQEFLADANSALHIKLSIPTGNHGDRFKVRFKGPLRPQSLGCIRSSEDFEQQKNYLLPLDNDGFEEETVRLFNQKLEKIYLSFKPSKKKPETKYWNQLARRKSWSRAIKRVQRYLGLRQQITQELVKGSPTPGWQVTSPAPFPMESAVRFVCVDVEAYERNRNMITEVGIAVLDTNDLDGVPPGNNGENWFERIEAYHLRVSEYKGIVNHQYVQGCPHAFNFGHSEFVSLRDITRRVGSIIGGEESDQSPIVMVGHEILADIQYLQKIDYDVWKLPQFFDEIDTKRMFQRIQFSKDGRALQFVCSELSILGENFHNAGNDAVYTMQAMVAMAIRKKAGGPQTESERWGQTHEDVKMEEWTDGDADDGGTVALKSRELGQETA